MFVYAFRLNVILASVLILLASVTVQAQDSAHPMAHHPAVQQQKQARGIDANTFIVAHPAGLALKTGHANQEHPAVLVSRQRLSGVPAELNASTFIVQPPASTRWTAGPAQDDAVALLVH